MSGVGSSCAGFPCSLISIISRNSLRVLGPAGEGITKPNRASWYGGERCLCIHTNSKTSGASGYMSMPDIHMQYSLSRNTSKSTPTDAVVSALLSAALFSTTNFFEKYHTGVLA